jgi:hypothetical protein
MALICLLLLAPTPSKYRWVNWSMAALSTFWFVLLAVEELLAQRRLDRGTSRGGRT